MKKMNKFALAAVASVGSVASASAQEAGATSLITELQGQLTSLITSVTAMQVVVFGAAILIVLGFVTYRLMKSSANKLG